MIQRIAFENIETKSKSRLGRIIVLTGARQTGKTTIARYSFPDYAYFPIDDFVQANQLKNLSAEQWHMHYPNAILDEVQLQPQLISSIKAVYDQFPDTRYLLLGSSQFVLHLFSNPTMQQKNRLTIFIYVLAVILLRPAKICRTKNVMNG